MFLGRRLAFAFRSVPALPNEITTIFKADLEDYNNPNGKCLLPATLLTGISVATEWTPLNTYLTVGAFAAGFIYHVFNVIGHSLFVRQIDVKQDFSRFYIHLNGGVLPNINFSKSITSEGVIYDETQCVLEIPADRVSISSSFDKSQLDMEEVVLKLRLGDGDGSFPLSPLNLERNEVKIYRDHWRDFCEKNHETRTAR